MNVPDPMEIVPRVMVAVFCVFAGAGITLIAIAVVARLIQWIGEL